MKLPVKFCRSCIALGLVICLYGPLVWAQDAAHVWGPDWQMIAVGLFGILAAGFGVYWQWQRTSVKELGDDITRLDCKLSTRISSVERDLNEFKLLLARDYQSRTELNRILDGMNSTLNTIQNTNLAIHRRLGELGVPYTPPT